MKTNKMVMVELTPDVEECLQKARWGVILSGGVDVSLADFIVALAYQGLDSFGLLQDYGGSHPDPEDDKA